MARLSNAEAAVIDFPTRKSRKSGKSRKAGINKNKEGSVRKINGKVYIDFLYFGERVRESSGMPWTEQNAKEVRVQLDLIMSRIKTGTFRFAEVFPNSKRATFFTAKEQELTGAKRGPDQLLIGDYISAWYDLLKDSDRVSGRTLLGYKSYIDLYLIPFFGKKTFAELNKSVLNKFVAWAKKQQLRGIELSNNTINKIFVPLKGICLDAAIENGWGESFNPFFGYKKLPEDDPYSKIHPFSLIEQQRIIDVLSDHWKPYFAFGFSSGLRQGEHLALYKTDYHRDAGVLRVERAFTRGEDGKVLLGKTKNRYSRRTIRLTPSMRDPLEAQIEIQSRLGSEFLFCTPRGKRINRNNLRQRVWNPALKLAGVTPREMKQMRHSFATNALMAGENPLWIAKVMGHRNTEMIIRVYGKYIEETSGDAQEGHRLPTLSLR